MARPVIEPLRTSGDSPILVTGGAGFIGSELVSQLVGAGARVTVLDNLVNGRRENLAGLDPAYCTLVVGDLRDAALVAQLVREHRRVIHLACLGLRHSLHSPAENHEVNAGATLTLLRLAYEAGVDRFVHVSSSEVYGPAQRAPMDEGHPTEPTTVYGATKLAGEAYARAWHRCWGLPVVVVRPFNAYGPRCHHEGDAGEVIPRFVLRAMCGEELVVFGDGAQTRDFNHVSDVARGIASAAATTAAVGETFNLASGAEIAIVALARRIAQRVGRDDSLVRHGKARPGDVRRLVGDASRARRVLRYAPRVDFGVGLDGLIRWYRESGSDPRELLSTILTVPVARTAGDSASVRGICGARALDSMT